MSNNGADIYMILLRPTAVPVAGEAVSHLFQGQVLLESLTWNLHNEDERLQSGVRDDMHDDTASLIEGEDTLGRKFKDLDRDVGAAQASLRRAMVGVTGDKLADLQEKHNKLLKSSMDKLHNELKLAYGKRENTTADKKKGFEERLADKKLESAGRNRNFEFTFTKRVDIASTQMLNSMKAGDIFPSGTLTIHKRSTTFVEGTSLVFTLQKVRLLQYDLEVEVNDTMTEMMEKWTCEFASLAYIYKNPPSHYAHGNAGQAVAKTLSQGTSRAFTMKNIGSPL